MLQVPLEDTNDLTGFITFARGVTRDKIQDCIREMKDRYGERWRELLVAGPNKDGRHHVAFVFNLGDCQHFADSKITSSEYFYKTLNRFFGKRCGFSRRTGRYGLKLPRKVMYICVAPVSGR